MKRLEEKYLFTGEGYTTSPRELIQIERNETSAIYSRGEPGKPPYCYEVFKIPVIPKGHTWNNGKVEPEDREYYPGASTWSKTSWTCKTLALARKKRNQKFGSEPKQNFPNPEKLLIKAKPAEGEPVAIIGTFTVIEYAKAANLVYQDARNFILSKILEGKIKEMGKRKLEGRGKPPVLYMVVPVSER